MAIYQILYRPVRFHLHDDKKNTNDNDDNDNSQNSNNNTTSSNGITSTSNNPLLLDGSGIGKFIYI